MWALPSFVPKKKKIDLYTNAYNKFTAKNE